MSNQLVSTHIITTNQPQSLLNVLPFIETENPFQNLTGPSFTTFHQRNTERDFQNMGSSVPSLYHLCLDFICNNFSDIDLENSSFLPREIKREIFEALLRRRKLTDQEFLSLLDRDNQVTSLRMDTCQFVTDQGIANLMENCPNLENLCLEGCSSLTYESLFRLLSPSSGCGLRHLSLQGTNSVFLSKKKVKKLRHRVEKQQEQLKKRNRKKRKTQTVCFERGQIEENSQVDPEERRVLQEDTEHLESSERKRWKRLRQFDAKTYTQGNSHVPILDLPLHYQLDLSHLFSTLFVKPFSKGSSRIRSLLSFPHHKQPSRNQNIRRRKSSRPETHGEDFFHYEHDYHFSENRGEFCVGFSNTEETHAPRRRFRRGVSSLSESFFDYDVPDLKTRSASFSSTSSLSTTPDDAPLPLFIRHSSSKKNQLESLNLSKCDKLTSRLLNSLILRNLVSPSPSPPPSLFSDSTTSSSPTIPSSSSSFTTGSSQLPLTPISPSCSLRSLDLSYCSALDSQCLRFISRYCRFLSEINLSYCHLISDESLKSFLRSSSEHLRSLNIRGCRGIKSLTFLPLLAVNITSLELSALCGSVVNDQLVREVGTHCTSLTTLNLDNCSISGHYLSELLTNCRSLRHLSLTCSALTSASLSAVPFCPNIQTLSVAGCPLLTDESIEHAAESFPNLMSLNISGNVGLTDASLEAISTHLLNLRELDLAMCRRLTDQGVLALSRSPIQLEKLFLYHCSHLTDDSIIELSRRTLRPTTHLSLYLLSRLTSNSLSLLADCCRSLVYLDLSGTFVTNQTLALIAMSCPQLEILSVMSAPLNDKSLVHVIRSCPHLKKLNLNNIRALTNYLMFSLVRYSFSLEHLSLIGCSLIDQNGYMDVALNLTSLKVMKVSSDASISPSAIRLIANRNPNLQFVFV